MKIKKIAFYLGYLVSCFGILFSLNSYIANNNHNKAELAAAYIHKDSRIEVGFETEREYYNFPESNYSSLEYNSDSYLYKYAKVYSESFISERHNSFISDEDVKVLVYDLDVDNYFGINLLEGSYPTDDSVIVSKEFADKYDISELPCTISFDKKLNGIEDKDEITICGLFDGEGNEYVTKSDKNGNAATKLCIIAKNSKNIVHFAAFNTIFHFLRSDDITNAFLLKFGLSTIGGVKTITGYDSLHSLKENSKLTHILNTWYAIGVSEPVVNIKVAAIIIFVICLAAFIFLNAWFFIKQDIHVDVFMLCLIDILLSLLLLVLLNNIVIGGNVLIIISHFSSLILLAEVELIISVILVIDLVTESNKNKRLANKKMKVVENENNGLVSIIIPTYNGSKYLERAIESALNQTYKNIEIIVVNDGSSDEGKTDEIAEKYKEKIKYIKKENGGVSTALNLGIENASGYFINWLSHDDELKPNSIEERLRYWISCGMKDKVIVGSSVSFINESGEQITRVAAKSRNLRGISDLLKSTVNGCSLLIPKSAFSYRKFTKGVVYMPDFYMWADLINDGYIFLNLGQKLVNSRIHDNQITNRRKDLLELDFNTFFKNNIEGNLKDTNYKELRKIMFILKRRSHLRPFYNSHIEILKNHLKETKHYDFWDSIELGINGIISWFIFIARKATSK